MMRGNIRRRVPVTKSFTTPLAPQTQLAKKSEPIRLVELPAAEIVSVAKTDTGFRITVDLPSSAFSEELKKELDGND